MLPDLYITNRGITNIGYILKIIYRVYLTPCIRCALAVLFENNSNQFYIKGKKKVY